MIDLYLVDTVARPKTMAQLRAESEEIRQTSLADVTAAQEDKQSAVAELYEALRRSEKAAQKIRERY